VRLPCLFFQCFQLRNSDFRLGVRFGSIDVSIFLGKTAVDTLNQARMRKRVRGAVTVYSQSHILKWTAKLMITRVFENGRTRFPFRSCCNTNRTVAPWLCLLQPWHHHMATACHSHHHNSCPTGIRTKTITLAKQQPKNLQAAQMLLPNFFVSNKEVIFVRHRVWADNVSVHPTHYALFKAMACCLLVGNSSHICLIKSQRH
jgi:hypothetical protein